MGEAMVYALHGIELQVNAGEFVVIMGASGSGKSTLMNILGCLDRPTSGTYILDGEDVSQLSKNKLADVRNRKIGFVFQAYNLLQKMDAVKNVTLPMLYNTENHRTDADRYKAAVEALESVGLGSRIHHRPTEMSGGQQQRVSIARALVNHPAMILADEPTGNLDTHSGAEILDLFHQLHAQGGTIVMVTHDPEIGRHAQRIVTVSDGVVLSDEYNPERRVN
jgi:putative ABC transport system ATP-binding protein